MTPTRVSSDKKHKRSALREDRPGTQLQIYVLAATNELSAGIDLASGALTRLSLAGSGDGKSVFLNSKIGPLDTVVATVAGEELQEVDDPSEPDSIAVEALELRRVHLRRRRLRRFLDALIPNPEQPLLGFHGPATSYGDRDGTQPSLTLINTNGEIAVVRRSAYEPLIARFPWGPRLHELVIEDPLSQGVIPEDRYGRLSGRALEKALGFKPSYLVISLTKPRKGHCYKVISAILPRP
ncbi:MAG: hypothetical protein M1131_00130 [Actinobacteria bacterium]|jgi:hypothetical protein|nr:hypothetical protein [Actinomycetota bacterium]MCL6094463.1 hypothetical protein [Actinomycetota bacterium]